MPRKKKEVLVLEKEEEVKIEELDSKSQSSSVCDEELLKKTLDEESDDCSVNSVENTLGTDNKSDLSEHQYGNPLESFMNNMMSNMTKDGHQNDDDDEPDLTDVLSVFFHNSENKNVVDVLGDINASINKNSKCILQLTQVLQNYMSKKG
jgi:hypothetical protein